MGQGRHCARNLTVYFVFSLCLTLTIALSGCSLGASSENSTEQTPTSGATATTGSSTGGSPATPTATSAPVTNCSQVSGFASAGGVSAGSHFTEVSFPANTVGYIAQKFETNSFQFEIINACTKSTTVGAIHTYYANKIPTTGFAQSSTFPYNGNAIAACGDPYCWFNASSHPSFQAGRYISLESVQAHGAVVTYSLRLSIAPIVRTDIVIQGTYEYDFDLVSNADVQWEQVTSTIRKMVPENGAKIANLGVTSFANVTFAQLKGKSYSTSPLDGNNDSSNQLVTGDVWAVHTDLGAYVKVVVTSYGYDMTVKYAWYEYGF